MNYMLFAVYKCQQVLFFFLFSSLVSRWFGLPEGRCGWYETSKAGNFHPSAVLEKEMADRTPAAYSFRIILDSISLVWYVLVKIPFGILLFNILDVAR